MRRLGIITAVIALLSSSAYLFVYLYRWSWHRAIIAGVFLLIVEIALATAYILERVSRVESAIKRLQAGTSAGGDGATGPNGEPSKRFEWISPDPGDLAVFVPVLLGAGVVLSGVAWLVERLARWGASSLRGREPPSRLQPLMLPPGVFQSKAEWPPPRRTTERRQLLARAVLLSVVAVLAALAVDRLGDMTQDRPDEHVAGTSTRLVVSLSTRDSDSSPDSARRLWESCRGTVRNLRVDGGVLTAPDGFRLTLVPAIGKHEFRRLRGCLEDVLVDGVRGRVVEVFPIPDDAVDVRARASGAARRESG